MSLIPLPARRSTEPWSASVRTAYSKLNSIYQTATAYISSDGLEAHCLQQYGRAIITDAYPLLLLMEESAEHEGIPYSWVEAVANQFAETLLLVDERWRIAEGEYVIYNYRLLHACCAHRLLF